ncbi:hypothetical protein ACLK19_27840 [Escherichia coli]
MLNDVNPMAMNTWAMHARYPHINRSGCYLCRERRKSWRVTSISTQLRCVTVAQVSTIWRFTLSSAKTADGSYVNLYPELLAAYEAGQAPKPNIHGNTRCQNIVRYEMFKKLGYFVTRNRQNILLSTHRGLLSQVVRI